MTRDGINIIGKKREIKQQKETRCGGRREAAEEGRGWVGLAELTEFGFAGVLGHPGLHKEPFQNQMASEALVLSHVCRTAGTQLM